MSQSWYLHIKVQVLLSIYFSFVYFHFDARLFFLLPYFSGCSLFPKRISTNCSFWASTTQPHHCRRRMQTLLSGTAWVRRQNCRGESESQLHTLQPSSHGALLASLSLPLSVLSLRISSSFCLCAYVCVSVFLYLCICLYISAPLYLHLSLFPSLTTYFSLCLPISLPISPSLSPCPFLCLSLSLFCSRSLLISHLPPFIHQHIWRAGTRLRSFLRSLHRAMPPSPKSFNSARHASTPRTNLTTGPRYDQ